MRKLNVKLLVGLVVGSVVFLGGIYFLHRWQVSRNANSLFTRAQKAEEKGEYDEAMKLYLRFVQHKKEDDRGWEALASAATKAADAPDASLTTKFKAYQLLEQTAAEIPDNADVRRQLVDFQISIGRYGDALTSLEPLIEKVETDHKNGTNKDEAKYRKDLAELELIRAKCLLFSDKKERGIELLSKLLAYDPVAGRFAETPGPAHDQVDAYAYLAMALRENRETEEQSPAILDRMVAENKDNPKAYLSRGQVYRQGKKKR
jgi:tetratricopeptide (TPR) repeat protein